MRAWWAHMVWRPKEMLLFPAALPLRGPLGERGPHESMSLQAPFRLALPEVRNLSSLNFATPKTMPIPALAKRDPFLLDPQRMPVRRHACQVQRSHRAGDPRQVFQSRNVQLVTKFRESCDSREFFGLQTHSTAPSGPVQTSEGFKSDRGCV